MVENVILDVCNFLKAKHILIPSQNQWLRGSIACFRETNRNCTPNQLKDFVFSQWKLADLKDICAPTLPNNCETAPKLILPGKYAIQINYAVNIGESFYKQLQKIRRPAAEDNLSVDSETERGANEISANRTLKLEITDGFVSLLGFEDKLITKLVEPFVPGVKAILNGPIECRKGVLFLKNENINILGGEVDTLQVPNAVENILARALKQPENPDPYKSLNSNRNITDQQTLLDLSEDDAEAFLQIPDEFENNHTQTRTSNSTSTNSTQNRTAFTNPSNRTYSTFTQSDSRSISSNVNINDSSLISSVSQNREDINLNQSFDSSAVDLDDDEEFALIAAETASLAEQNVQAKTPLNTKQTSLHNFFSQNKDDKCERSEPSSTSNNKISYKGTERNKSHNKASKTPKPSVALQNSNSSNLRTQMEESYSSFMESESRSSANTYTSIFKKDTVQKVNDSVAKVQNKKENTPFDLLLSNNKSAEGPVRQNSDDVLCFPPKKYPSTQTVRGSVESITQKLSITENKWGLSAMVKMRGIEMEVDFSAEALDKIFGMTATELQAKRKEVKQNVQLKEKINEILKSSQRRIQQLDCDMKVHFTSYIAKPVILQILD